MSRTVMSPRACRETQHLMWGAEGVRTKVVIVWGISRYGQGREEVKTVLTVDNTHHVAGKDMCVGFSVLGFLRRNKMQATIVWRLRAGISVS
jgi:hypothetical protein